MQVVRGNKKKVFGDDNKKSLPSKLSSILLNFKYHY